jgi:predicted PurR-regulated permease PerM
MEWKLKFAKWKQRYDIAASFLGLVNFILLSITASAPIRDFLQGRFKISLDPGVIVISLCVMLVVGFLLFGLFLERIFDYWENLTTVQNLKNPQITEILNNSRKILKAVEEEKR